MSFSKAQDHNWHVTLDHCLLPIIWHPHISRKEWIVHVFWKNSGPLQIKGHYPCLEVSSWRKRTKLTDLLYAFWAAEPLGLVSFFFRNRTKLLPKIWPPDFFVFGLKMSIPNYLALGYFTYHQTSFGNCFSRSKNYSHYLFLFRLKTHAAN